MSKNIAAILRSVELARQQRVKRNHTTADLPPIPVDAEQVEHDAILAFEAEVSALENDNQMPDCKAVTPGLVRVSRQREPKSIHDPVAPSRLSFERPRKRMVGIRDVRSGDLPEDNRKVHARVIVDGKGVARGAVSFDPFRKRISFAGFGLIEREPVRKGKR